MASNLKVIIDNPQTMLKIPSGTRMLVRRSCHATLQRENYDSQTEVNVVFVDNEMLREYDNLRVSNFEAREVIAIPGGGGGCLGKLIISVERIMELTKVYNRPFEMGIVFASVHGVFNLLGQYYTDQQTKDELMLKEARVMNELGYSPLAEYS